MRLVIVNPNISEAATRAFVALGEAAASPGTVITGATGPFGVDLMRRPAEIAIGVHALLEALAQHIDDQDAAVIAAFGDYGAAAAVDLFRKPVITIADAAFASIRLARCRYSMLVPAPPFVGLLRNLPAAYGATDGFLGIHAVTVPPSDPGYAETAEAELAALLQADAPDTVMLVGPPLAVLAGRLRAASPVPLVEGVSCAVRLAEALISLGLAGPWPAASGASEARKSGISDALAAFLSR